MKFGVIAAGQGSRLAEEGVMVPKPLVKLGGVPLIERLIDIFSECGAESVSVVVNEEMPEVSLYIERLRGKYKFPINMISRATPSSMHTMQLLTQLIDPDSKFIVTTVYTVFRKDDFTRYVNSFESYGDKID